MNKNKNERIEDFKKIVMQSGLKKIELFNKYCEQEIDCRVEFFPEPGMSPLIIDEKKKVDISLLFKPSFPFFNSFDVKEILFCDSKTKKIGLTIQEDWHYEEEGKWCSSLFLVKFPVIGNKRKLNMEVVKQARDYLSKYLIERHIAYLQDRLRYMEEREEELKYSASYLSLLKEIIELEEIIEKQE
jgi:hypothetical protein